MSHLSCNVRYFCFGAFLIFLGSVLLCALGFTIILPHEATRDWRQVTCLVINATYDADVCSCSQQRGTDKSTKTVEETDCLSTYPCLRVHAVYNATARELLALGGEQVLVDDNDFVVDGSWNRSSHSRQEREDDGGSGSHSDEVYRRAREKLRGDISDDVTHQHNDVIVTGDWRAVLLHRTWSDAFFKKCSLHECGDQEWNIKESRRFLSDYGRPGKQFVCYTDPADPDTVIVSRTPTLHVVHALIWPAGCLLAGGVLWLGLCFGCWRIDQGRDNPQHPTIDRSLM